MPPKSIPVPRHALTGEEYDLQGLEETIPSENSELMYTISDPAGQLRPGHGMIMPRMIDSSDFLTALGVPVMKAGEPQPPYLVHQNQLNAASLAATAPVPYSKT